jgi:hypothetical protein
MGQAFVGEIPLFRGQVPYGEGCRLASPLQIELGEQVADVVLDCLRRDEKSPSDLAIGQTLRE